ncbi:MAG: hypothetical protein ED556_05650 [Winogradskyella sp.]|uniref:hypothetical protein n=1 Tax=Winogradskyella sp. TaxID=1883156 RepID=UPI000F407C08|nr:hypothetical protein [Winogradskyella sp.]RNC86907.1 MAG: hypothetical protein ED556_05650 [Winogradskyella sp.]
MKVEFKKIRKVYKEINDFLENASGENVKGLNTKICEDLGLWGDDNYFLLEEFVTKNNLNFDKFDYSEHFESEGELFNGNNALIGLLTLPFLIVARIIKWIFPKIKTPFDNSFLPMKNERADLTFGDLIVCKLKGEFCLRKETLIEI